MYAEEYPTRKRTRKIFDTIFFAGKGAALFLPLMKIRLGETSKAGRLMESARGDEDRSECVTHGVPDVTHITPIGHATSVSTYFGLRSDLLKRNLKSSKPERQVILCGMSACLKIFGGVRM